MFDTNRDFSKIPVPMINCLSPLLHTRDHQALLSKKISICTGIGIKGGVFNGG
jgi:hypothetical protein